MNSMPYMKQKSSKAAFTLLEMLLAMLAAVFLMITVVHVFYYAWLGWIRNTHSVSMQRDATLAMERIAREIRSSDIGEISGDSDGIYFAPSSIPNVRPNAVNILATDIPVFPGVHIAGFNPPVINVSSNTVKVSFTLFTDENADQNYYEMTVTPRN